jgi:hypothetical protein
MRRATLLALAATLLAVAPLHAQQLYRWVDEKGVVNYGDQPPPKATDARRVDAEGRVTVVPGLSKEQMQRAAEIDERRRAQAQKAEAERRARDQARAAAQAQAPAQPQVVDQPADGYFVDGVWVPWGARPPGNVPGDPVQRPPVRPDPLPRPTPLPVPPVRPVPLPEPLPGRPR